MEKIIKSLVVSIFCLAIGGYDIDNIYRNNNNNCKKEIRTNDSTKNNEIKQTKSPMKSKFDSRFANDEKEILYRIVEAEATDKSVELKMAVAATIYNRIESGDFPDTVYEVVFQKYQFTPTSDGRYYSVEVTKETIYAVEESYNKGFKNGKSLYFEALRDGDSNKAWFNTLDFICEIDGVSFYK